MSHKLEEIYQRIFKHFGPQHWWPGETPFEVMVGAILTQNTNWENVRRAIINLQEANLLSPDKMLALDTVRLAEYIRPAGYYNLKAKRLKNMLLFIENHQGGLEGLLENDTSDLRKMLLSVKGIGPETADSILLYAAQRPVFVVDAYTHRILTRHNLIYEEAEYYEIQNLFLDSLPEDTGLFNEYHALLVQVGKNFCKKNNPRCESCPLAGI